MRSSRSPRAGTRILIDGGPELRVAGREGETFRLVPRAGVDLARWLESHGRVPLPPYVRRAADEADAERYQTSYARADGEWAGKATGMLPGAQHTGSHAACSR